MLTTMTSFGFRSWGLTGGHLARFTPRRLVVAEERSGTLGGGLSVVAVRGEAAPGPQAHLTAPYQPRYSLARPADRGPVGECTYPAAEHPEGIKLSAYRGTSPGPTPCLAPGRAG